MVRDHSVDEWLNNTLKGDAYERIPLAGDASQRRYYRVLLPHQSYVLMDAPPPESCVEFVDIANRLKSAGLQVPEIVASDLQQGFLLLSDFGDRLYLQELNDDTADHLYQEAFQALVQIQQCSTQGLATFNTQFAKDQLGLFEQWYVRKHKKIDSQALLQSLHPAYEVILSAIDEQPWVFVHRDYHSRNLMVLDTSGPGILDFQDARLGPITYDLVSLLQDCYVDWPRGKVVEWIEHYRQKIIQVGLLDPKVSPVDFVRWFDWTGVQRHLKNLGIFTRLYYRDNKSRYLNDIPRVLGYLSKACSLYAELKPLQVVLATLDEVTEV